MRQCGDCQLCCRLLPVPPLDKKGGEKCKHQKFGKGCAVYHTAAMPPECGLWNCRWLVEDDTGDLSRPDRSHYVIDLMPDFITWFEGDDGERHHVEAVQIWIDPKHPTAHRDPALRRYLLRRGAEGKVALIRFNSKDAFTLIPPNMASDGQWHEKRSDTPGRTHTFDEIKAALS